MGISNIEIKIEDVKLTKISDYYDHGIAIVDVVDETYKDRYTIKLQESNLGIGALCKLNGVNSYQADRTAVARSSQLRELVNAIAAGQVIDPEGDVI